MKCCVTDCKNLSRFTFPKNETVRKQWLEAIRRPDFKPKHKNGLCADHFRPEDIPTESFSGGYKLERAVLRRHTVPSIFPWTKPVNRYKKKEKTVIRNVGNHVEIWAENSAGNAFEYNYKKCLENLVDNPFQSINIKSERFELSGIENDHTKIYNKIENNESSNGVEVSQVIVKTKSEFQPGRTNVACSNAPRVPYINFFYLETDVKLREHDYHVKPTNQVQPKSTKPRYDIEDFVDDSKALKVFTGLGNYERFMEVLRGLGAKIYNLTYCGNGSTGKLSVKNQFFLTLWKLKRNCSDFDLSRHFNISIVAVGNIFRTWVRFLALERPKIEIRQGREIFEYYKLKRYEKYYVQAPVAPKPTDGVKMQVARSKSPDVNIL